jgi:hypothetical protein
MLKKDLKRDQNSSEAHRALDDGPDAASQGVLRRRTGFVTRLGIYSDHKGTTGA